MAEYDLVPPAVEKVSPLNGELRIPVTASIEATIIDPDSSLEDRIKASIDIIFPSDLSDGKGAKGFDGVKSVDKKNIYKSYTIAN